MGIIPISSPKEELADKFSALNLGIGALKEIIEEGIVKFFGEITEVRVRTTVRSTGGEVRDF